MIKNRVIYHNEERRVTIWLVFMVILSNKIMQNYPKNTPKRGKGNLPWFCGNAERVIPIYGVKAVIGGYQDLVTIHDSESEVSFSAFSVK